MPHRACQFGFALLLFLPSIPVGAQDRDLGIHFRKGVVDSATLDDAGLDAPQATDSLGTGHRILQFERLPGPDERQQLESQGVTLLDYIPNNAYWVSINQSRLLGDVEQVAGAVLLSWRPDAFFRVSEEISDGDLPRHAVNTDGTVEIQLLVFADTGKPTAEALLLAIPDVEILEWISPLLVQLRLPENRIPDIARLDIVHWLEPKPAPNSIDNVTAAARIGVSALQAVPYSLDGSGVAVGIWDGGKVDAHGDYSARLTIRDDVVPNSHATHVAGTIGGSGAGDSTARGMAPAVNLFSYDWSSDVAEMRAANSIRLSNHSYGITTGWNYNGSSWTDYGAAGFGQYSATTAGWDDVVFDTGLAVFKSAGNDRGDCPPAAPCDGPYDTIGTQGTAKNIITICATTDSDAMSSFSSWGPVNDGRVKPDVCANGTGLRSTGISQGYYNSSGTSMASPSAAGAGVLLYQLYQAENHIGPTPHMLKALLIHAAKDLGRPGPDYEFGWGLIDADRSADLILSNSYLSGILGVPEKETLLYPFEVPAGATSVKATLAWTDPQGSPGAAKALINDLNMVLIAPDGTTHLPWLLNPAAPGANAIKAANAIDNVEQVLVSGAIQPGRWVVKVTGVGTIPQGPQSFALVVDGLANRELANGVTVSDTLQYASPDSVWRYYVLDLPPGATKVFFELFGITRGANLFVSSSLHPTFTQYDCRGFRSASEEDFCWLTEGLPPNGARFYIAVTNDHFDAAGRPAAYSLRATWLTSANPVVLTAAATSVSQTTAMLNATIDFITPGTTVRFDWGETPAFGHTITSTAARRRVISGLQCDTKYYFRAVATTAQGTTEGGNLSFQTNPCPVPLTQLSQGIALTGVLPAGEPETQWKYYYFDLPAGRTIATVELLDVGQPAGNPLSIRQGTNANLYLRKGQLPTVDDWDCRPYLSEFYLPETCTLDGASNPPISAGRWYVGVNNDYWVENTPMVYTVRASWQPQTFAPIVVTGETTAISQNAATLQAEVNPRGLATNANFQYGLTPAYGNTTPTTNVGSGSVAVPISRNLTGLQCGKTYHYRAVATNSDGTGEGEDKTFATSYCPIQIASVGNGDANSYVLPPGEQNESWHTYEIELPEGVTNFTAELFGLSADADLYLRKNQPATVVTYDCRSMNGGTAAETCALDVGTTPPVSAGPWFVSVTNQVENVGISYTLRISWATATPDSPPAVFTGLASSISSSGATLEGEVNPEGLSTSSHFEYGLTTGYGTTTASQDVGSGDVELPVSDGLSNLQCEQTYHYRLVAGNAIGTSLGDDQSFSTGECPPESVPLERDATVALVLPPGPRHASWHYYKVQLPDDVVSFTTELFDLTADADLYVRKGLAPTLETYDCSPYLGSANPETCVFNGGSIPAAAPGDWYIAVTNWSENTAIGYSLRVSWTTLPSNTVFTDGFENAAGNE